MDREEYCNRVISVLRRATAAERESVRTEIDAHIEDHMEALLELGWDEQLAEERTLAAMGDPEEIGRELDQQYSTFWRYVGNIAAVMLVLLLLFGVFGGFRFYHIYHNILARTMPWREIHETWQEEINLELDIRQKIGSDIVRVLGSGTSMEGEQATAIVMFCQYDKNPFGMVSEKELRYLDSRGEELHGGGSGHSTAGAAYSLRKMEIRQGELYLRIVCNRYGDHIEIEVPLRWEGSDGEMYKVS